MYINLERQEVEQVLDGLRHIQYDAAEEIRYCGTDSEISADLQRSIDAAEQLIEKISKQANNSPEFPSVAVKVREGLVQEAIR